MFYLLVCVQFPWHTCVRAGVSPIWAKERMVLPLKNISMPVTSLHALVKRKNMKFLADVNDCMHAHIN